MNQHLNNAERAGPPRMAWSVEEVAMSLGVSRRLVYELIRTNALRSVKVGGRRLVRHDDLKSYLDGLTDAA